MTQAASMLEEELAAMERPHSSQRPLLPWLLVAAGLLAIVSLGFHGYSAYATIAQINDTSRIETPNPVLMFQDVATNGPRIGATVVSSSRSTYGKALEQFLLDGTGFVLGLVLVVAGVFVRVNL
jgi:hypothetical protein